MTSDNKAHNWNRFFGEKYHLSGFHLSSATLGHSWAGKI